MNLNMEMVLLVIIAFIMGWFLSSNLIEGVIEGENDLDENDCPKQNPNCGPGEPSCSLKCAGESFLRGIKTQCERHKKISSLPPFKKICSQLPQ
jgi:hypothetical protein